MMVSQSPAHDDDAVYPSSGTVFADLDLPEPEEDLAKATLAMRIARIVATKGWSQNEAARVMGIDQPKVSALVRGRLSAFSAERLLSLLIALDQDVEIVVRPKAADRQQATLRVSILDETTSQAR
jgi:predicted XRE-type DNA-binding protein